MVPNMNSSHPAPHWQSEPDIRGTFNIISSCIGTLVLCAWSAVHINISENKWYRIRSKIVWLMIGLLAPETILFVASNQWKKAGELMEAAERYFRYSGPIREDQESQSSRDEMLVASTRMQWSRMHGFYAAMGGFALDMSQCEQDLPGYHGHYLLTPRGLMFLMEHEPDLIPQLSQETIKDHRMADGIAKAILAIQTLWFCANCSARLAQSLPLSLLEITTLSHAFCTIFSYVVWW